MRNLIAFHNIVHGRTGPGLLSKSVERRDGVRASGGILEFAERTLGFPLEEKQRELLAGAGRRVILNCTRQWGKSWMAAVALVYHALQNAETMILVAGPTQRQSGELLLKARAVARRAGLAVKGDGVNRHSLVFANRARAVAIPASEEGIRGFSGVTLLMMDEAAMMRDDIYFAVRPMLTQKNGSIWLLSTPKGPRGFFHRTWTEGGGEWQRVMVPATACPRFTAAQLAEEEQTMGGRRFAQEFLCEFVSAEDGLFDAAWLEGLESADVRRVEGL